MAKVLVAFMLIMGLVAKYFKNERRFFSCFVSFVMVFFKIKNDYLVLCVSKSRDLCVRVGMSNLVVPFDPNSIAKIFDY